MAGHGSDGQAHAATSTYNNRIKINTPITCDARGVVYFGFVSTGSNPLNLVSGFARLDELYREVAA